VKAVSTVEKVSTVDKDSPELDEQALRAGLGGLLGEVRVVDECASTNAELAAWAADSTAGAGVLATSNQTAGRGRLGRTWEAPAGSGIACSVLIPTLPVTAAGWLPALTGLAVRDLVISTGIEPERVGLKWPNDVLIDGRKVAGVLAERLADGRVVIGFGVNVAMTEAQLPVPTATSLFLSGATSPDEGPLRQTPLLVTGLLALGGRLTGLASPNGQAALADEYAEACTTLGSHVRVERIGLPDLAGTAVALAADASLVVRPDDGSDDVALAAGDVTHVDGTDS
jgi:BirA family transcriptional regulator, biotin operon repressor / biotin---[acetyl-CoA-carboxylase] ligase